MASPDEAQEVAASEPAGWAEIAEWTGGLSPGEVESLTAVRELEAVFPLLHALAGRSHRDFLVRAAVLEALVGAERSSFSADDLREVLYWLDYDRSLQFVLPPRPGGTLGLLEAAPGADVVVCTHTGFEGAASLAHI